MKSANPLISVAIYLRGNELDPAVVSKVLGIEPSRSQKRGGFKHRSTRFIAKIGVWALKISSDSRLVENMIDELLQKIGHPPQPLDKIEGVEDAHLDIFIAWKDGPNESVEFSLTQDHLAKLNQLGLSTCFTVDKPD